MDNSEPIHPHVIDWRFAAARLPDSRSGLSSCSPDLAALSVDGLRDQPVLGLTHLIAPGSSSSLAQRGTGPQCLGSRLPSEFLQLVRDDFIHMVFDGGDAPQTRPAIHGPMRPNCTSGASLWGESGLLWQPPPP
eukprot:6489358-Amphidinium_carterae.1